ncbi:hypothetical protein D3C77_533440 [compost metagenome]
MLRCNQSKPAGNAIGRGNTSRTPWALSRNGRTTTSAVINAAAGLPGMPIQGLPATSPKASGLPGCIARRHTSRLPKVSMACLRWSSSPTETPPELSIRSHSEAARLKAWQLADRSSAITP